MAKKCSVDGCKRKHNSHGYCSMHLHRIERYGDPLVYQRKRTGATINNKKEYYSYKHMVRRCIDHKCKDYKDYGGRGIKVCDRWLGPDGFINFLKDMGERPKGYSLDRINVNGNYDLHNCRWANDWTQANNKRGKSLATRGVYQEKRSNRYVANIKIGHIRKTKKFEKMSDAILQRRKWEEELNIIVN